MLQVFVVLFLLIFSSCNAEFFSKNNQIYFDDNPLQIKGINFFGFETKCHVVHGLWANPLDSYLSFIKENDFNAIRVPIDYNMNGDIFPDKDCINFDLNPELKSKNQIEILHILFKKARKLNLLILLDMHTMDYEITPLAHIEYIESWKKILPKFQKYNNLLGIELKNEPHLPETWINWMNFVLRAMSELKYDGLYFIEGIQTGSSGWGNSFEEMKSHNFLINDPKIVFSPHVYGFSVRGESTINDGPEEFDKWFGFLNKYNNAIVITEFGGKFDEEHDIQWHKKLKKYLKKKDMTSSFYWCLNSNSGDTNGLLIDWDLKQPDTEKLKYLKDLNPYPTVFNLNANLRN